MTVPVVPHEVHGHHTSAARTNIPNEVGGEKNAGSGFSRAAQGSPPSPDTRQGEEVGVFGAPARFNPIKPI